jgi:hypothetical protein
MRIKCSHCNKSFSKIAQRQLSRYEVGQEICPKCHKQNKRYISTFDVNLSVFGNMVIYGIAMYIMSSMTVYYYTAEKVNMLAFVAISMFTVLLVVVGLIYFAEYIYSKAPFKAPWANLKMNDDIDMVKKTARRSFLSFVVLLFFLAITTMYINYIYYFIGFIAMLIMYVLKLKKAYEIERTYYQTTYCKNN